jgi:formate hydrogenlyase subunit 3/multisubunit Na+/H+ antiporter MnhD subunit
MWGKKWQFTLYMISLKEWNLDNFLYQYLWSPLKQVGNRLHFLSISNLVFIFTPLFMVALVALNFKESIPAEIAQYLPELMALVGLVLVIKSFTERRSARLAFVLVLLNHFWVALAVSYNDALNWEHIAIYLSGIVVFGIVGYATILRLRKRERKVFLNQFYGHSFHHPKIAFAFLVACLGVAGFPISPTFIGEDLIFSHIQSQQLFLAVFVSLSFILDGLSLIRIYARLFLGPHHKSDHEIAYRAS